MSCQMSSIELGERAVDDAPRTRTQDGLKPRELRNVSVHGTRGEITNDRETDGSEYAFSRRALSMDAERAGDDHRREFPAKLGKGSSPGGSESRSGGLHRARPPVGEELDSRF